MATTPNQINSIADREFGQAAGSIPRPNTYWIGLLTQAPNNDGTYSGEVSTVNTGYSRIALPNSKGADGLTDAVDGKVSNKAYLQFPTATSNWGTVTHVGIFSAQTGGQLLYWSQQAVGKAFSDGDTAFFDIGDIFWTVQNIQAP